MNCGVPNSTTNSSGPSIGASSLVTDANSVLSGGPHMQRSASINNDSYLRLPASPMSFSSNNISGSSLIDGSSSIVQQSSHQDQMQKQGTSTATSQLTSQDPGNVLQVYKKPRLDMRPESMLQQQVIQQLLQRQDSLQLHGQNNPQLQSLIQQQRLLQQRQQQQQILQSLSPVQRAHVQQQQQEQLRHQPQQHVVPTQHLKQPFDGGICFRRLMQYIYHQRHRPPDNSIDYWRKFVTEYFSPHAKERWCVSSLYNNAGNHALGTFPRAAMDSWHCYICGSTSGKGFEDTFEVLARLRKIRFDSGVIDELLFLDMPHETRLPSGLMFLEYAKAIQESVYENLRVVLEGRLRITFTPDLKILTWEFCAHHHEELLPRRLVAPQVNQLMQVAQKYQNAVAESGSAGVSTQDLQTICDMFVSAGRQLARKLELQSLNELGFSKRYIRCLQISEVVNSMKDLIDFEREHKIGPIESLKQYPHQVAANLQNQKTREAEQVVNSESLSNDQNNPSKIMAMHHVHPSLSSNLNNSHMFTRVLNNSAQAMALNNYQSFLRQNSASSNSSAHQPDVPCAFSGPKQPQSVVSFECSAPSLPASLRSTSINGLSDSHQRLPDGSLPQQNNPQYTQRLPQHVVQQILQEMFYNGKGSPVTPQQSLGGPSLNSNVVEVFGGTPLRTATGSVGNVGFGNSSALPNNVSGIIPSKSDSLKAGTSSPAVGSSSFNLGSDVLPSLHMPDLVQDIEQEFTNNGILNGESGDISYEWRS